MFEKSKINHPLLINKWLEFKFMEHAGMRKFRIDQDFLIEHWRMIYVMPVVLGEICFWMKLNSILDIN